MKKFMLSCKFSFKAYGKNVMEKVTKCSLETTEVLLDADRHVLSLPKFNIYQDALAPNCFKSPKTS